MNTLKFVAIGLLAWPAFAMADSINGTLQVTKPLPIHIQQAPDCRDTDPRPSCIGPFDFDLGAGNYNTSASMNGNYMHLIISGGHQFAELDLPTGAIPANGNFAVSAKSADQAWDVSGTMQTTESDSPEQSGWAQCSYPAQRWVCGPYGCGWQNVIVYGQQYVSFHDHFVSRQLQFSASVYAHYLGNANYSQRIFDQVGPCR